MTLLKIACSAQTPRLNVQTQNLAYTHLNDGMVLCAEGESHAKY